MKRVLFLMIVILMVTGCGISRDRISKTVTTSMQENFNTDKNFKKYNLKVGEIMLFEKTKKEYTGLVDVYYKQEKHQVSVKINIDGDNVMWQTVQGAFLFLVQDDLDNLFN